MEEKIQFMSEKYRLEGLYCKKGDNKGAIIVHPHPLYGGDMSNPVVESLTNSCIKNNISTIRFNFRGVGGSQGTFGGGIDEQNDVLGAIALLQEQGMSSLILVGYSFGSWVLAHMQELPEAIDGMIFVSPPVAFMPFRNDISIPKLNLVITGEEDELAPAESVRDSLLTWNSDAKLEVIDYADHFYYDRFAELGAVVSAFLSNTKI